MEFEPLSLGNDVIEFDMMGLGDIDHSVDHDDLLHDSPPTAIPTPSVSDVVGSAAIFEPYIPEGDTNLEPYEGMEFESEEASKAFYNSYARRTGFSTRVSMSRRSRRDGAIIQRSFVCAREGFRVDKHGKPGSDREGRVKRPRPETRVGCKAMLVVKIQDSGKWVVSAFVKEHNHELVPPERVHCLRSHRHVSGAAKSLIDTLQGAGIGPRGIMSALESLTVRYNNLRHEALKYVDEGVKTVEIYNVSMVALEEAANRVSLAKKNDGRLAIVSRTGRDDGFHLASRSNTFGDHKWGFETLSADEQDKKIQKLERRLDRAQRKCELYRASLLSVLKDIEEQKLQLSVKVENIKLGMKESSIV
ncbi:protein FAR1-RELATED SEQUENCE 5-like [Prunus yedoensis var. nudiflora]|uniref:Protein FAR1-RELATED SEQUENCE 5-like n=1 Tax=Prunus yedoensis var. nudiflora TaxID=2094558 RepID=A0A314ZDG6_PRUYE|nr:protein FAR1-RELATED SEQUENCE 5-like [Prunus yedoensis var. nudiflora]